MGGQMAGAGLPMPGLAGKTASLDNEGIVQTNIES